MRWNASVVLGGGGGGNVTCGETEGLLKFVRIFRISLYSGWTTWFPVM